MLCTYIFQLHSKIPWKQVNFLKISIIVQSDLNSDITLGLKNDLALNRQHDIISINDDPVHSVVNSLLPTVKPLV